MLLLLIGLHAIKLALLRVELRGNMFSSILLELLLEVETVLVALVGVGVGRQ
jgi:hypothetical protein